MTDRWNRAEWEAATQSLLYRSSGLCEVCGERLTTLEAPRTVRHHRQRRAIGGDRLANLVLIHGTCHTDLHAHPEKARANGWIVSAYIADCADVPMLFQRTKWVALDDAGTITPARPIEPDDVRPVSVSRTEQAGTGAERGPSADHPPGTPS